MRRRKRMQGRWTVEACAARAGRQTRRCRVEKENPVRPRIDKAFRIRLAVERRREVPAAVCAENLRRSELVVRLRANPEDQGTGNGGCTDRKSTRLNSSHV